MSWSVGISATENSYSVADNTSSVTVTFTVYWDYYATYAADNPGWSVSIDGTNYTGTCNFNEGHASSGSKTIASITQTIGHNSDGSKSIGYSGGFAGNGSGWKTASGSITLTTIPRVSDWSVPSSVTINEWFTVSVTPKANFTDVVTFSLGSHYHVAINSSGTSTKSWSGYLASDWMAEFTTASSAVVTITLTTKSGSTVIGTKTTYMTVYANNYTIPLSVALSPTSYISAFGSSNYVQLCTKVAGTISASGVENSSITSRVTTIENKSYSGASITSDYLTTSGSVTVSTTVYDSRGKSRTVTQTITVVPYYTPAFAVNAIAKSSDNTAEVSLVGSVAPVTVSSTDLNSATYTVTWEDSEGNTGTLANAVTITDLTFDDSTGHPSIDLTHSSIDATRTYKYTVTITDATGSVTKYGATGIVCMSRHAGGDGVTFGAEASQSGLIVADGWDAILKDTTNGDVNLRESVRSATSYPTVTRYVGYIATCDYGDSRFRGYGSANIIRYCTGLIRIDFEYQVTNFDASTYTSHFYFGIDSDVIKSALGYSGTLTPLQGFGSWEVQNTSGVVLQADVGYATAFETTGKYWHPARIYDLSGDIGGWPLSEGMNAYGNRVKGYCFGQLS